MADRSLLERAVERADPLLVALLLMAGAGSISSALERAVVVSRDPTTFEMVLSARLSEIGAAAELEQLDVPNPSISTRDSKPTNGSLIPRSEVLGLLRSAIACGAWFAIGPLLNCCDEGLQSFEFETLASFAYSLGVSNEWVALVEKALMAQQGSSNNNSTAVAFHKLHSGVGSGRTEPEELGPNSHNRDKDPADLRMDAESMDENGGISKDETSRHPRISNLESDSTTQAASLINHNRFNAVRISGKELEAVRWMTMSLCHLSHYINS